MHIGPDGGRARDVQDGEGAQTSMAAEGVHAIVTVIAPARAVGSGAAGSVGAGEGVRVHVGGEAARERKCKGESEANARHFCGYYVGYLAQEPQQSEIQEMRQGHWRERTADGSFNHVRDAQGVWESGEWLLRARRDAWLHASIP